MIQDIFPHTLHNEYLPGQIPKADDIVFRFSGEKVLCRTCGLHVTFPRADELCGDLSAGGLIYLFALDEKRFFLELQPAVNRRAAGQQTEEMLPDGFSFVPLSRLRKKEIADKPLVFAAITARHLNDWYDAVRFCGRCAAPLIHSETERAMVCPVCGKTFYPRINPAVIIGVTNGDQLLMTKYAGRDMPFYALVAGFTEIGETLEETVQREVMEEVGLTVTNIRYYKSQPWGYADDILAGFYCDVTGSPQIRMDENELKEAVWMDRADIPGQPDDFSLTNEMMMAFKAGLY